jgi:HAD superfamily hydrolase (TIGR01509 family)
MVKMTITLLFDFSRVLLFPIDQTYTEGLNKLHQKLKTNPSFSFLDHFQLNNELLDYIKKLKDSCDIFMFTSEDIQNSPEIRSTLDDVFIRIFSAKQLGYDKTNPEAYVLIAKEINKSRQEIIFIDDNKDNIDAAQKAGLRAIQYFSNEQIINELKKIL